MIKRTALLLLLLVCFYAMVCLPVSAQFAGAETRFPKPYQSLGATNEKMDGSYEPGDGVETFDGISYTLFYKDEVLPTRFVTAIASNKKGDVFVGTKDVGIFRFSVNSSKRQWFNKFPVKNKKLAIHKMVYDEKKKDLFVATTAGVFRVDDATDFYDASCKLMDEYPETLALSLALDKSNGLWVGTSKGLYDPSGTFYSSKDGLPSDMVNSLQVDHTGNLWIGTDGGLVRKSQSTFRQADFGDVDKRWINDLSQEQPLELFIPLEKYQKICSAFFAGIRKNPSYGENKVEIDKQMKHMLEVEKPGSDDIIVAASDGLYRVDIRSLKAEKIIEGWFNALCFANTGQFYALDNEMEIKNFSPTRRLLGRFKVGRRIIERLEARIMLEVSGDAEPDFLDEKTIAEMQGMDQESLHYAILPYIQNIRATAMHFDIEGRMWIATDGGGLYCFSSRLNTSNFFVKSLAGDPESGQKMRHLLQTEIPTISEHSDITDGKAAFKFAYKDKTGFYPLKEWIGKTSDLGDNDWERIAKYVGEHQSPKDSIKFIGLLAVDPWQFIPCIHFGDIPELKKHVDGFADLSSEAVLAHEKYVLPVVPEGHFLKETYPPDHPLSLAR